MEKFDNVKNKVHDASGVENPNLYYWQEVKGVYYPSKKI